MIVSVLMVPFLLAVLLCCCLEKQAMASPAMGAGHSCHSSPASSGDSGLKAGQTDGHGECLCTKIIQSEPQKQSAPLSGPGSVAAVLVLVSDASSSDVRFFGGVPQGPPEDLSLLPLYIRHSVFRI